MSTVPQDSRAIARLHQSRRQLEQLLVEEEDSRTNGFPRSKVLRSLMNQRNATLLALGAGGVLLLLRPQWLGRAMRLVPIGAVVRMLATQALTKGMFKK